MEVLVSKNVASMRPYYILYISLLVYKLLFSCSSVARQSESDLNLFSKLK